MMSFHWKNGIRPLAAVLLLAGICGAHCARADEPASASVARVNGKTLTADRLQLQFYLDQLAPEADPQLRSQLVQRLIDRELIRQFLESREITPDPAQLQHQTALITKLISSRGEQVEDVLQRLHLSQQSLQEVLALPLAWDRYVRSTVTDAQIRQYWEAHREQLDGTRVKASQIVLLHQPDDAAESWAADEARLADLRTRILAGELTFAAAAEQVSQSPSRTRGGDLGEFEYRGRVDPAISRAAFATPEDQISPPFRSRLGVHLVQTREKIPGQLSLEDAREQILATLGRELWEKQVQLLRQSAHIELTEMPAP